MSSNSLTVIGSTIRISDTGNRGVPGIDLPVDYDAQRTYVARNTVLVGNCLFLARTTVPPTNPPQFDIDGIPQNDRYWAVIGGYGGGARGVAATIDVGSVFTLPAGSFATVDNAGSEHTAIFNFGIPAGEKGEPGGDLTDEARTLLTGATDAATSSHADAISAAASAAISAQTAYWQSLDIACYQYNVSCSDSNVKAIRFNSSRKVLSGTNLTTGEATDALPTTTALQAGLDANNAALKSDYYTNLESQSYQYVVSQPTVSGVQYTASQFTTAKTILSGTKSDGTTLGTVGGLEIAYWAQLEVDAYKYTVGASSSDLSIINFSSGFKSLLAIQKSTAAIVSSGGAMAWNGARVYGYYDASTRKMQFINRSDDMMYRVDFGIKGYNSLPDQIELLQASYGDPAQASFVSVRGGANSSDSSGPIIFRANVGGDPSETTYQYTGGNHQYPPSTGTTPTAANTLLEYYADGNLITQTGIYVAGVFTVKCIDLIKATNTVTTSPPRYCARKFTTFYITPGVMEYVPIYTFLEACTLHGDNGPQSFSTGYRSTQSGTQIFAGMANLGGRMGCDTSKDTIDKATNPNAFAVILKAPAKPDWASWMDRSYGVGDGSLVASTSPLIRGGTPVGDPSPETANTKWYHAAAAGTYTVFNAGQSYTYRGGWSWTKGIDGASGFDGRLTISQGGIQQVRLINTDGTLFVG